MVQGNFRVERGKIGKIICKPGDKIYDTVQDKLVTIAEGYYGITFKDIDTRFTFNFQYLVILNEKDFRLPTDYERLLRKRGYHISPEEAPETVTGIRGEIVILKNSILSKEDIVLSFTVLTINKTLVYSLYRKPNAYEKRKVIKYLKDHEYRTLRHTNQKSRSRETAKETERCHVCS